MTNIKFLLCRLNNKFTYFLRLIFLLLLGLSTFFICGLWAEWTIQTVENTLGNTHVSMVLDNSGNPHIAFECHSYNNKIAYDLIYAKWSDNQWFKEIIDSEGYTGYCTSIALDSLGDLHISYCQNSPSLLKYAKQIGTVWSIETLDSAGVADSDTSIKIDGMGNVHIAYSDKGYYGPGYLKYAKLTENGWSIETVDSTCNAGDTSMALDSAGNPHIVYNNDDCGWNLKYAKWTGSSWNIQTIDPAHIHSPSIAIDKTDNPHIVYTVAGSEILRYAKWTGSEWNITTICNSGTTGPETSIALDSLDNPHIAFINCFESSLKYIKWTGSGWKIERLDSGSMFVSIAIDNADNPHIAYNDGYGHIKYAKWEDTMPPEPSPGTKPVLSWAGEEKYIADGLDPEIGTSTTTFIYRVKYVDGDNDPPKAGYPKIHINRNNVNITGSPFTMNEDNPQNTDYINGKIYSFSTTLSCGNDYSYFFEAYDAANLSAGGTPTTPIDAPDVFQAPLPPLSGSVKTRIKIPKDGKKVSGNRLTIMAEIVEGDINDVGNVLFQYKPSSTSDWIDIPVANFNHPNPDCKFPYFVHWNVEKLTDGYYNLRAVAKDKLGNIDLQPAYITIIIDHVNPDIKETIVGTKHNKEEKISNLNDNFIFLGEEKNNNLIQVFVPIGAINEETKIEVSLTSDSLITTDKKLISANVYCEVSLENGEIQLNKPVMISIPYKDMNNDSIVDDLNIKEENLKMFYLEENTGKWIEIANSVNSAGYSSTANSNLLNNQISAQVNFLSVFGLFATVSSPIPSKIMVYPNPYKPESARGVTFTGLTTGTEISIYTLSGKLVKRLTEAEGMCLWTTQNANDIEVVPGLYIYVIKNSNNGEVTTGKIVIRR